MKKNKILVSARRSTDLTKKAAAVVDRIKSLTRIPKKYLIEEAIIEYLPKKYERR